jgi:DNA primase
MSTADVLHDAQAIFRRYVHSSWVFSVLQERKLAGFIKDEAVGYAPRGGTLVEHLVARGHSAHDIVAAGIARQGDDGRPRSLLRDRLTIPIHSTEGELVGFVGRAAPGVENGPKYVNTIYAKRETVYGLCGAREALEGGAWPVLVEGILDVWAVRLAAAKAGLPLAPLAVCGTALTREHVEEIARVTPKPLTFMFDGDKAGAQAFIRAWELASEIRPGVGHRALGLPNGTDPADLWRSAPRLLRDVLSKPQSAAQRVAELRVAQTPHARESVDTKVGIARRLGADLGRVPASEVADYVRHVAALLRQDVMTTNATLIEGMGGRAADLGQPSR